MNEIKKYIKDAINSDEVCEYVKLAYRRHFADLEKAKEKLYPYKFNEEEYFKVVRFVETFSHTKGKLANENKKLQLEKWQKALIYILFGWRRKEDGKRRFTKCYVEIARKNGKTLLASILCMYVWLCEGESGSQFYTVATKREQAKISWNEIKEQIKKHPFLNKKMSLWQTSITKKANETNFCKALGRDDKTEDGQNPYVVLVDEYHAHQTNKLIHVMESGMAARIQPFTFFITTAGTDIYTPCYEYREQVIRTLEGVADADYLFGIIYTLDENDSWEDETKWVKANPNLKVGVEINFLRERVNNAKDQPSILNDVLTKNFNKWTQSKNAWIPLEQWDECKKEINREYFNGKKVVCAVDLSATTDLSSICYATFPDEEGVIYMWWHFWLPAKDIHRRGHRDGVPYDIWCNSNYMIHEVSGVINTDAVYNKIMADGKDMRIEEIAYDPHFATQLANKLATTYNVVPISQSYDSLAGITESFENAVFRKKVAHNGNPVMRWMIQCCSLATYNDKKRPVKPDRNSTGKRIDGITTAMMAVGRILLYYSDNTSEYITSVVSI